MTIATILGGKGRAVVTVRQTDAIVQVARVLREKCIGAVVVTDAGGAMCGVLSERDIVRALADTGAAILDQPASAIMTAEVVTCVPSDTVQETMAVMTERRIRHLPVLVEGRLAGLVSIGDLVKSRIADAEREAEALRTYITQG